MLFTAAGPFISIGNWVTGYIKCGGEFPIFYNLRYFFRREGEAF